MGKGIPCHSNSMSWVLSQWMDEKMKKKKMGDNWWKKRLGYRIKTYNNSKDN